MNGRQVNLIGPYNALNTYYSLNVMGISATVPGWVSGNISNLSTIETSNAYINGTITNPVSGTLYLDPSDNFIKASYSDGIITAINNRFSTTGPFFVTSDYSPASDKIVWTTI